MPESDSPVQAFGQQAWLQTGLSEAPSDHRIKLQPLPVNISTWLWVMAHEQEAGNS